MPLLNDWGKVAVEKARKTIRGNAGLHMATRIVRNMVVVGPFQDLLLDYYRRKSKAAPATTNETSFFEPVDEAAAADSLKRLGFVGAINLKPDVAKSLHDWAESPSYQRVNPHAHNATIHDIGHNGTLIRIIRSYLGAEPILHSSYVDWAKASRDLPYDAVSDATMFHYDTPDFRSCSARFYLTEVDELAAPHTVIGATHGKKGLRDLLIPYIANDLAAQKYGDKLVTFTGPPGTGWLEDLSIIHRRAKAKKPRLTLSYNWVISRTPMTENLPDASGKLQKGNGEPNPFA